MPSFVSFVFLVSSEQLHEIPKKFNLIATSRRTKSAKWMLVFSLEVLPRLALLGWIPSPVCDHGGFGILGCCWVLGILAFGGFGVRLGIFGRAVLLERVDV